MERGEVFKFEDPREILVLIFEQKKRRNPQFSIRAWSKKLGFKNPSLLSDVLRGKRAIKPEFALRISDSLGLTDEERNYFEALVYCKNASSEAEKEFFSQVLQKFSPQDESKNFDTETAPLREWYYWILDEVVCLKDFKEDYKYLAKRFGHGVTPQQIEIAINDLLRFGLIARDKNGKLIRPKRNRYVSGKNIEDKLVQKYYKSMLEIASEKQQQGKITCQRSNNIPMKRKDIAALVEAIEEFRMKQSDFEDKGKAEEVYHLGVFLFQVTQSLDKEE